MRLRVKIKVPVIDFKITNRAAVVEEVAAMISKRIQDRTQRGESAFGGPLPRGKQDHPPLQDTGSFVASFGYRMGRYAGAFHEGEPYAIVRPMGPRPDDEQKGIKTKKRAAFRRARVLRAAEAIGNTLQRIVGSTAAPSARIRAKRTVIDQGSLAAILSVEPKDPRALAGQRAVYRVFQARETELTEARAIVMREARIELEEIGEKVVESK